MAPSAVLERIRKLESQGFIDGYEVRLNPHRFRRSLVGFVHISMTANSDTQKVGNQLSDIDEVQEVHFVAGQDGYLIKVRVAGPKELDNLVRKRIRAITGVRGTRSEIVLSTMKETARIPLDDLDLQ
jgi:Lrp/AsnC family leucine-responsive transcriptional regulator